MKIHHVRNFQKSISALQKKIRKSNRRMPTHTYKHSLYPQQMWRMHEVIVLISLIYFFEFLTSKYKW